MIRLQKACFQQISSNRYTSLNIAKWHVRWGTKVGPKFCQEAIDAANAAIDAAAAQVDGEEAKQSEAERSRAKQS